MLSKNNIETSKNKLAKDKLIKLASETDIEEKEMQLLQDMKYEEGLKQYLKMNPNKTEEDYQIEVIGIDLVGLSRENLIGMLKNEYPEIFNLLEDDLGVMPTIKIKEMLDNLDKDKVPFANGGRVK
jgi:activator of 2-hydroxyglutaryl-CoA dehydratase